MPHHQDEVGMTYHDNDIVLYINTSSSWTISGGSYTISEHSVSSGQDPDNKIVDGSAYAMAIITNTFKGRDVSTQGTLTFTCGRHNTSGVANWWNDRIPSNNNTFGHGAGDLNFAFVGTLTMTVTTEGVTSGPFTFSSIGLAQGQAGSSNNWWFGGTSCTKDGDWIVKTSGVDANGKVLYAKFQRGGAPWGQTAVNVVGITELSFSPF